MLSNLTSQLKEQGSRRQILRCAWKKSPRVRKDVANRHL
ncbi:MAG: hypothetical protein ACLSGB_08345 [Dorea sp.]